MAEQHAWHCFDDEMGYDVRQVTDEGDDNVWEVRDPEGNIVTLDDDEFDQFRSEGPNPKGLK